MPCPGIHRDRDRPGCQVALADQRIDHVHRQVVHRLVAEVFQAFEGGGKSGTRHAGDDDDRALAGRSGETIGRALASRPLFGRDVFGRGVLGERPFGDWHDHDGSGTGASEPVDSLDAASRTLAGVEQWKGASANRRICWSSSTQVSISGSLST